jgi:hypothetical protein
MRESTHAPGLLLTLCLAAASCGGTPSPPAASEAEAKPEPASPGSRPQLTAEACEAGGGMVVGDIGDGAIHRPDYRCPSGAAPSGSIRAAEGGPIAIEGSVCCPKP